tara:strand:- start:4562 stop:5122 length:561 start_codon:yes stop_codon:yes gene_type:complete
MSRFLNLVFSLLIFIFLLFPMLLIAILILIIDREYPLYFSPRIGKNNTDFLMPKFRTMSSNAPQVPTHLLSNPGDYILSTGPFLRKYSLDELPQIVSVVKGDMAFVGPRPALFNQDDLISLRNKKGISQLKPGVTGWAQVNGRDELSILEKVEYDEEYFRKSSLGFDIYIIWLTIIKVIKRDGISH